TNPVLVDGENGVIAGHGRLAAARKLGMEEVPVIELARLSPTQKRALILADNRVALDAGWDEELLALEFAELADAGYDLALTGFDADEIDALLADDLDDAEGDRGSDADEADAADDVPPASAVPVSRLGDVWLLGEHRLICGDATDASVIAALMAGQQAALCFTSPPYANQRNYTNGGIADWDVLMRGVFGNAPMVGDGQVLVNLGLVHRDSEVVPYWDAWIGW
ncbi:ParB N-terminal domain-containing protein, partial [Ralstonia solanacearum]|uniref:ParB N-terminal domain-containing protein n=1 Tax=Ralstonia solanacearum TaxID=305 RepID=UPI0018C311AC